MLVLPEAVSVRAFRPGHTHTSPWMKYVLSRCPVVGSSIPFLLAKEQEGKGLFILTRPRSSMFTLSSCAR